jgi:hypothetical protein
VAYKKAPVRALIEYRCEGCGKTSSAPGNCESADCEKKSTPLARTCSRSGTEPHAKPAGKDKKKDRKKSGKKE